MARVVPAPIAAGIAAAEATGQPCSQWMYLLFDWALRQPLLDGGAIVQSYVINGRTVTYGLQQVQQLREYYRQQAIIESGNEICTQGAEMSPMQDYP